MSLITKVELDPKSKEENPSNLEVLPLHGEGYKVAYERKNETLTQRQILILKCKGLKGPEIAEILGLHVVTVNDVMRQPWFKENFLKLAQKQIDSSIEDLIKEHSTEALQTMVELMRNARSEQVRAKCCGELLGFIVPKKMDIKNTNLPSSISEVDEQIARKLESIETLTKTN